MNEDFYLGQLLENRQTWFCHYMIPLCKECKENKLGTAL